MTSTKILAALVLALTLVAPMPAEAQAPRTVRLDGVTVNALIIDRLRVKAVRPEGIALVAWFRAHVLHGSGAFWVLAKDYEDYERAMRAKLLRELELPMVGEGPAGTMRSPS